MQDTHNVVYGADLFEYRWLPLLMPKMTLPVACQLLLANYNPLVLTLLPSSELHIAPTACELLLISIKLVTQVVLPFCRVCSALASGRSRHVLQKC